MRSEERNKKKEAEKEERNALFNMTEEEYEALTEEQKKEVDEKRKSLRKKIVRSAQEEQNDENSNDKSRHSHKSSRKSKDKKDKDTARDGEKSDGKKSRHHRSREEKQKDSTESSAENQSNTKTESTSSKKKKGQVPTDPNEYSVVLFNLVVGTICNKIKESTENFNVIDPTTLLHKVLIKSQNEEEEDKNESKNRETKSLQQINSLILKEECSIDDLQKIPIQFIPSIQKLKESAFTDLIPPEKVTLNPDLPIPTTKFEECPPFFSLQVDDVERSNDFRVRR